MDLAGLAALLAVPVSVFAAVVAPLRERGLVARLRRIEKLLAEGTVAEPQRTMLGHARDRLAERIAAGELQPRYVDAVWLGTLFVVVGPALLAWTLFDPTFDGDPRKTPYQIVGFAIFIVGELLLFVRAVLRTHWLNKHRDTNYETDDSAFL